MHRARMPTMHPTMRCASMPMMRRARMPMMHPTVRRGTMHRAPTGDS